MLQLERLSNSNIIIKIKEGKKTFEPLLVKAFAIAILFHAVPFFLFHITSFQMGPFFLFPPVTLNTISIDEAKIEVAIDAKDPFDEIGPPPLFFNEIPSQMFGSQLAFLPDISVNRDLFDGWEESVLPIWEEPLSQPIMEPKVKLYLSGYLADLLMVQSDPILKETQASSFKEPILISFDVRVDPKKGEVFWYELTDKDPNAAIYALAKKILLSLRFQVLENSEFLEGKATFAVIR